MTTWSVSKKDCYKAGSSKRGPDNHQRFGIALQPQTMWWKRLGLRKKPAREETLTGYHQTSGILQLQMMKALSLLDKLAYLPAPIQQCVACSLTLKLKHANSQCASQKSITITITMTRPITMVAPLEQIAPTAITMTCRITTIAPLEQIAPTTITMTSRITTIAPLEQIAPTTITMTCRITTLAHLVKIATTTTTTVMVMNASIIIIAMRIARSMRNNDSLKRNGEISSSYGTVLTETKMSLQHGRSQESTEPARATMMPPFQMQNSHTTLLVS